MHPAFSIIFFTTLAGAGQGLVIALAGMTLSGRPLAPGFVALALVVALVLLLLGLGASFLHLGHPERAWRTVLMWRTSWMSREVIVLPVFIAIVGAWWLAVVRDAGPAWQAALAVAAIIGALLLWYCTAMIYACIRFIQEWAHPLTLVNYTLIGLSSGLVLCSALAVASGQGEVARTVAPWALVATLVAWATRTAALVRNAKLKPKSTLQSATGIQSPRLVQTSMGMTAGSFNTREFFHGATLAAMRQTRLAFIVLGFALPSALLAWGWFSNAPGAWLAALPLQALGLVAERWFFFAQARHPQNLYYQVVS